MTYIIFSLLNNKLLQEVSDDIDLLRIRVGCGVSLHLNCTVVVLKTLDVRVPKIGQEDLPRTAG